MTKLHKWTINFYLLLTVFFFQFQITRWTIKQKLKHRILDRLLKYIDSYCNFSFTSPRPGNEKLYTISAVSERVYATVNQRRPFANFLTIHNKPSIAIWENGPDKKITVEYCEIFNLRYDAHEWRRRDETSHTSVSFQGASSILPSCSYTLWVPGSVKHYPTERIREFVMSAQYSISGYGKGRAHKRICILYFM